MVDHPLFEPIEVAGQDQRVEDHQAPEGDPVDGPHALQAAVHVSAQHRFDWRVPDEHAEDRRCKPGDQRREPRRHAEAREKREQHHQRDERHQNRDPQAADRNECLSEQRA